MAVFFKRIKTKCEAFDGQETVSLCKVQFRPESVLTQSCSTLLRRGPEEKKGSRAVDSQTHCLNSLRVAASTPSRIFSCALDPLYCTTLSPDSLPENWKEKHCMVTVCFGLHVFCLRACVFLCQHFCVPPILTNYIHTGRGESLERHKSKFQNPRQYFSFTLSILRFVLSAAFPNIIS